MWIAIFLGSSVVIVFIAGYINSKKDDVYDGSGKIDRNVDVEDL